MVNLTEIKNSLKTILTAANTTTGSPIDLSLNLQDRVESVMTYNPDRFLTQPSLYPFVTVYIEDKEVEQITFAKNQTMAKRRGRTALTVACGTWRSTVNDNVIDDSDDELELLMENVEQIIRSNHTANSYTSWIMPIRATYHNANFGEESHLRVGIIEFELSNFY